MGWFNGKLKISEEKPEEEPKAMTREDLIEQKVLNIKESGIKVIAPSVTQRHRICQKQAQQGQKHEDIER